MELSRVGWTATADSDAGAGYTADKSIDGNPATFWHSADPSSYPHHLSYDLGSSQNFNLIRFKPRQDAGLMRQPVTGEVYVSDDGVNWGSPIATLNETWNCPNTDRTDKYLDIPRQNKRHIRLKGLTGTDDGDMACADFRLYDTGYPDFAPHDLTSATSHPPFVVSQSSMLDNPGTAGFHALDGKLRLANYWVDNGGGGVAEWKLDTGGLYVLHSYHIQVHGYSLGQPNLAPKNWTLEGSIDGSSWDVLGTVINQTGWGLAERRMFDCDVILSAYRHFRANITANNGDTYTQLGEVFFYGEAASADVVQPAVMVIC